MPLVDMGGSIQLQPYRTVDACTRIPATALLHVVQLHLYRIVTTFLDIGSDIYPEGVVAISPATHILAVDIHLRLTHRTVEHQFCLLSLSRYM